MSNHVCREVLCLIQKPGNVASFLPLAYEALFDMRKASVHQKPSQLSLFFFYFFSITATVLFCYFFFSPHSGCLWGGFIIQLQPTYSRKNKVQRSDGICWGNRIHFFQERTGIFRVLVSSAPIQIHQPLYQLQLGSPGLDCHSPSELLQFFMVQIQQLLETFLRDAGPYFARSCFRFAGCTFIIQSPVRPHPKDGLLD